MQQYLTWRSDPADLTQVGRVFHLPEEERVGGVDRAPASFLKLCAAAQAGLGYLGAVCVNASDIAGAAEWAADARRSTTSIGQYVVPATRAVNGLHAIVAAEERAAGRVAVCHRVGGLLACHYVTGEDGAAPRLWRITTELRGAAGGRAEFDVMCHNSTLPVHNGQLLSGCHILGAGDVVFPGSQATQVDPAGQ